MSHLSYVLVHHQTLSKQACQLISLRTSFLLNFSHIIIVIQKRRNEKGEIKTRKEEKRRFFKYNAKKKIRKLNNDVKEIPNKIIRKIKHRKSKKGVILIDNKIIGHLKEQVKGKDYKNKWIELGLKSDKEEKNGN